VKRTTTRNGSITGVPRLRTSALLTARQDGAALTRLGLRSSRK
jgi:hypothetical protein